jgi:serine/threonine-protein kinase
LREGRAVVRIESEHVARVLDVGRLEGAEPYLVMEYLEGQDLAAALGQRGVLGIAEAVGYLQQACEAIAEAHAAGIVHRDLKPANLYLVDRGAEGPRIKVLDFGISKSAATSQEALLTKTSVVMGSPLYMSPEQLRSTRDVDERADIWALGVILYEMLVGREPFPAAALPQLCAMILEGVPTSPRSLRPEIPVGLDAVILRCLEKLPSARFANVAELSLALVPFGSDAALASAQRAERSLRRTGAGRKSSIAAHALPSPAAASGLHRRSRFALIVALGVILLLGLVLLRRSATPRSGTTSESSAHARPLDSLSLPIAPHLEPEPRPAEDPKVVPSLEPSQKVLPQAPASVQSPRRAPFVVAKEPRNMLTKSATVSSSFPAAHSPSAPKADDFGGRE